MVSKFVGNLAKGADPREQLKNPEIPRHCAHFVNNTLDSIERPTSYVASQFFFGREDPIPDMFKQFISTMEKDKQCEFLKYYLARHVEIDGDDHGPLAEKLLQEQA